MKIVVKEVGQEPEIREVENELHVLQGIVGGYIQCINLPNGILCICNEEGKVFNMPANVVLGFDVICGDILFCSDNGEDFESLNDEQIDLVMNIVREFKISNY